jgi:hypothetical protein
MFLKKKKIINYKNQIILTNGSSLKIISIKYKKIIEINTNLKKK